MSLIVAVLVAISLSMDAFSLATSVGTMGLSKKVSLFLSLTVGIFHFFMPLLGSLIGSPFVEYLHLDAHFVSAIIFFYIGLQMFKEFRCDEKEDFKISLGGILIFALGVSLDSFGVGFTMRGTPYTMLMNVLIFSVFSACFTFLGLRFGSFLNRLIGDYAILFGTVIMWILAIINFVNFCAFNLL